MTRNKIITVPFRRKSKGKTNYKKRLGLLKSKTERIVIRKSNKNILAQIIRYADDGDHVVLQANSTELEKYGWKRNTGNLPAAYLVGYLLGKKAEGKTVIVDFGLQSKADRLFALVKGAIDAGLKINCPDEAFPNMDRLSGKHIKAEDEFEAVKKKIDAK